MLLQRFQKRYRLLGVLVWVLLAVMLVACTGGGEPTDSTADTVQTTVLVEDGTNMDTETVCETATDTAVEESVTAPSESTDAPESTTDGVTTPAPEEDSTTQRDPESKPEETTLPPELTPKRELPTIDIYTEDGEAITSKEEYVKATISVDNCAPEYYLFDCSAQIRVRGNTTGARPKKPYRIKFDTKQSMLGLNDGARLRNWCLLADYYDLSMLRTWSAFSFADVLLEGKYYSSDCTPVEVYLNDEYMGVYLLCEQTQIDDDRVDIYEKRDDETSVEIGYLMIGQGGRTDEPDTVSIFPNLLLTDRQGQQVQLERLNFALSGSGYTSAQKAYVRDYVTDVIYIMYEALYNERYYFIDEGGYVRTYPPDALEGMTTAEKQKHAIEAVFDLDAAARMCVLEEILKNQDIATFNMYIDLSPRGDKRLTLAAPWDYDFAMGNNARDFLHDFEGRHASELNNNHYNPFYIMLSTTDWFDKMCREVWQDKYDQLQAVAHEVLVRTYRYADAYNRDWARWGAADRPELEKFQCFEDLETFTNHADAGRFLYTWLMSRMRFVDLIWGNGLDKGPALEQWRLDIDFTEESAVEYLNGERRCSYETTSDGLYITVSDEARDPYFYINYMDMPDTYRAADYYVLEIEYMIPTTNSLDEYFAEIYPCTGSRTLAESGVLLNVPLGEPTGEFCTLRLNMKELAAAGWWQGTVNRIRLDFFETCAKGDSLYIRSVKLLPA